MRRKEIEWAKSQLSQVLFLLDKSVVWYGRERERERDVEAEWRGCHQNSQLSHGGSERKVRVKQKEAKRSKIRVDGRRRCLLRWDVRTRAGHLWRLQHFYPEKLQLWKTNARIMEKWGSSWRSKVRAVTSQISLQLPDTKTRCYQTD